MCFSNRAVVWMAIGLEVGARIIFGWPGMRARLEGFDPVSARLTWMSENPKLRVTGEKSTEAHDPRRGWVIRPGLRDFVSLTGDVVNSSPRGTRGRVEHSYEKTPGRTRIVAVGDSYTFGREVSDDSTYPSRLGQLLPRAEVINLGVVGYGLDQVCLQTREEAVRYHPDLVILGFLSVDVPRITQDFTAASKPRFELNAGRLDLLNVPVPDENTLLEREPYRSSFMDLFTIMRSRLEEERTTEKVQELTVAILDDLCETVKKAGAVPVIVGMPTCKEFTRGKREPAYIEQYCRQRRVLFHSVSPALEKGRAEGRVRTIQRAPGHWTPSENRVVAEDIHAFLVERGLVRP